MPQWVTTALTTVLSLVVGIVTAIVSVRLSLRRFRAERWWERKVEAYSRIVDALHSVMEYCSVLSDEEIQGREITDERRKQLLQDYERAVRELKKATSVGAFIISKDVADALMKLETRPRLSGKDWPRFEILDDDYDAYSKTLAEVQKLAKRDLEV